MHRLFTVGELMDMTIQNLDDKQLLLALCRTCRQFYLSAVPILWESLPSILPLIQFFPPDVVKVESHSHSEIKTIVCFRVKSPGSAFLLMCIATKCFTRPLCADDWTRFDSFALHVLNLIAMDWTAYRTAAGAQVDSPHEWFSRGDGRPLLPKLRSLRWSYQCLCDTADLGILALFLSPGLVSLDLDLRNIWNSEGALSLLCDAMRRPSSHIADLTIRGVSLSEPPEEGTYHHNFLHNILAFGPTLKRLHIDHELFVAIQEYYPILAQLESLVLDSWSGSNERFGVLQYDALSPRWECLREISGQCGMRDIRDVWAQLIPQVGQSLRKIMFHDAVTRGFASSDDYRLLFWVIGDSCPALESLAVSGMNLGVGPMGHSDVQAYALRQLYKCSMLSELTLWTVYSKQDISLSLHDTDIIELAGAFEELRILHIGADSRLLSRYSHGTPRLTLNAIRTLAMCCPKLQHLTLTIDSSNIPSNPLVPEGQGLPSSSIQTLNFGHSPIDNPRKVAEYLGRVCSASRISSADWSALGDEVPMEVELKKMTASWMQVARYMESIQQSVQHLSPTLRHT
jgi:hypothetical protein